MKGIIKNKDHSILYLFSFRICLPGASGANCAAKANSESQPVGSSPASHVMVALRSESAAAAQAGGCKHAKKQRTVAAGSLARLVACRRLGCNLQELRLVASRLQQCCREMK